MHGQVSIFFVHLPSAALGIRVYVNVVCGPWSTGSIPDMLKRIDGYVASV
jgi:hypothetical protein